MKVCLWAPRTDANRTFNGLSACSCTSALTLCGSSFHVARFILNASQETGEFHTVRFLCYRKKLSQSTLKKKKKKMQREKAK